MAQDVAADGFVTARRVFEQGGAGAAVSTVWDGTVDLAAGTVTVSETVAAGTDLAATRRGKRSNVVHGQPTVTDAMGNTATTAYDSSGRLVSQTTSDGTTVTTRYRTHQHDGINATITTTPDGVVTTEERDVLGRVIRSRQPSGCDPWEGAVHPSRTYPGG